MAQRFVQNEAAVYAKRQCDTVQTAPPFGTFRKVVCRLHSIRYYRKAKTQENYWVLIDNC